MQRERQTHYELNGRQVRYDYYTVRPDPRYGGFNVHGFGKYSGKSVLAGQVMKQFLDAFRTREDALKVYPEASNGSKWLDPEVTLNHLPGEDDPVPGGMYPDDWTD